jgi:3-dehydroquinate synthase
MPHGEAVAIGCLVEAHLSMHLGYLSSKDFEQIQVPYRSFSLKLPSKYTRKDFLSAMSRDKKKANGKIRFVLIDQIGHAIPFDGAYCQEVSNEELEPSLHWMEQNYG